MNRLLLTVVASFTLLAPAGDAQVALARVGEVVPNFRLLTILRGDGRTTLNEFRGQPLLIAHYSTNVAGMNSAKDAAKLASKYDAKGLVTIFIELESREPTGMLALALHHESEYSGRLLKTQKMPIPFEWNDGPPPGMALIGVDGTLLASGTYQMSPKIEKMIVSELKKRKQGWGSHATARKARALTWGSNDLGAAREIVRTALEAEPGQAELLVVKRELDDHFASFSQSVDFLLEQGEVRRALERAEEVAKSVKNDEGWTEVMEGILARFDEEEIVVALAEDKQLTSLLKPVFKKGPKKGQAKKLRAFAEQAEDTRVAARAVRYAEAVEYAMENNLSTR